MYEIAKILEETAGIIKTNISKELSPEVLRALSYNLKTISAIMYKGEDLYAPVLDEQASVNQLLYNLVENFEHDQKIYNELLFDLVFELMAAKETSDRDERYRIRIMLLYKVLIDLGQSLFPNSYINKKNPAKLKAI